MGEVTNEVLDEVIRRMEPSRSKPGSLGDVTLALLEELKQYRDTGLKPGEVQQIVNICAKNTSAPALQETMSEDFNMDAPLW